MVFLKDFFEKVDLKKKIHRRQKSMQSYPACKELRVTWTAAVINSFPARDACHLLIIFVNSLDPDQAWQNVKIK